jgi:diaminopimelate decarboxylase
VSTPAPHAKVFPITAEMDGAGHLRIGGCDAVALAGEFGTPLYVFDEATLEAQATGYLRDFRAAYPATQVSYACKAFINVALARKLAAWGVGFDVVSGGELALLRAAGVDLETVYFHGNNKTPQELRDAVSWGIGRIVVDGFNELTLLNEIAGEAGVRQPVLLRISPSIDPHTHRLTTTGTLDSKFGFPLETGDAARAVRLALDAPHLDVRGLHFHLGSPIFELEPYTEAVERVLAFAAEMREEGLRLQEFSPGGGFAIAYLDSDEPPTKADYANAIVGALREGCARHGLEEPTLIIEPGRSITGPAGVTLYTVGVIKDVPGVRTYVSVDGGMGDNIRPALYGSRYVALVADDAAAKPAQTVTIAGKYCESGDVLVRDALIAPVKAGSIIAIPASGAYAPSMASTYNLNGRPAVVLVRDGKATLIRRRESYADLMAQDVL